MGVQEKVAAQEFTQRTTASPEQIRAAGAKAMEAAKSIVGSSVRESSSSPTHISYVVKGRGGFKDMMAFRVSWDELGDGSRVIRLTVGEYVTVQEKVMVFIPITPKSAPALGSLQRFSKWLRRELEAAQVAA